MTDRGKLKLLGWTAEAAIALAILGGWILADEQRTQAVRAWLRWAVALLFG